MYFDSHAHLDDARFDEDRPQLLKGLPDKGICCVVNPAIDVGTSRTVLELTDSCGLLYAAVGVHPHEVGKMKKSDLESIEAMSGHPKVVAIGEIGLDYYYDFSPRHIQRKCFAQQLELAAGLKLPVIIHDRDAHRDTLDILKAMKGGFLKGVMHCYSGSWEMAKDFMDLGLYISLGGTVTFKNAKKPVDVAANIPLDRLLIETDSPYLTPVPFRGKRNEPGYVSLVAEKIAEIRGMKAEEVGRVTTENAKKLFEVNMED